MFLTFDLKLHCLQDYEIWKIISYRLSLTTVKIYILLKKEEMYSTTWNPKNAIYIACKIPHFTKNDETAIINQWGGECIFNSFASNQRGVAILLCDNFENKILNTKKDDCGNLLGVDIEIEGKKITLINICPK